MPAELIEQADNQVATLTAMANFVLSKRDTCCDTRSTASADVLPASLARYNDAGEFEDKHRAINFISFIDTYLRLTAFVTALQSLCARIELAGDLVHSPPMSSAGLPEKA